MIDDLVSRHTKNELLDIAKQYGITEFPEAKIPTMPNKVEIATSISKYLEDEDSALEKDLKELPNVETTTVSMEEALNIPLSFDELPDNTKRRIIRDILNMKKRVIVTRVNETQKIDSSMSDDDSFNEMLYVSWGNDLVRGMDKVIFGREWTIRVGAILNLKNAVGFFYKKVNGVYTVVKQPIYQVVELDPFTKEEIEELRTRQSYIESMSKAQKALI